MSLGSYQLVAKTLPSVGQILWHQRSFFDLLPPFTLSFVDKRFLFEAQIWTTLTEKIIILYGTIGKREWGWRFEGGLHFVSAC